MATIQMGQNANGAGTFVTSRTRTLSNAVADLVVITGSGKRTVRVYNNDPTNRLWIAVLSSAAGTPVTGGADNAYFVQPASTDPVLVPITPNGAGVVWLSIVGATNQYVVQL